MIGFQLLSLTALLILTGTSCGHSNYYWREYTGAIPSDAVVAGHDIRGDNLYIGQAYVKNWGWQVVPIHQGVREVVAVQSGAKKIDKYIKILCGEQNNFHWIVTNETNFHTDLKDKHGVIGGHEDGLGDVHIGRISYEGETKIGKVNSFKVGQAKFHFHDRGTEKQIEHNFEVLYFDEASVIDPRVSR